MLSTDAVHLFASSNSSLFNPAKDRSYLVVDNYTEKGVCFTSHICKLGQFRETRRVDYLNLYNMRNPDRSDSLMLSYLEGADKGQSHELNSIVVVSYLGHSPVAWSLAFHTRVVSCLDDEGVDPEEIPEDDPDAAYFKPFRAYNLNVFTNPSYRGMGLGYATVDTMVNYLKGRKRRLVCQPWDAAGWTTFMKAGVEVLDPAARFK